MSRLEQMITWQYELQVRLGHDTRNMSDIDRITYIRNMVLACTDELHEALAETSWKPWTNGDLFINRNALFAELRDAWQFLTNLMLVATESSPADLAQRLHNELSDKIAINHDRADTSYDGVTGKCPMCRRDLAEVVPYIVTTTDGRTMMHCVCGHAYTAIKPAV